MHIRFSQFWNILFTLSFFNWNSLHARMNNHCKAWSCKKKNHKKKEPAVKTCMVILAISIIGQKKALYRQRIPVSKCARKETVDIDILVTSADGDRKVMQSIRITSRLPSRIRNWNQLSQFRWISTKVIPIEKTEAGYISTMSQGFKRGRKLRPSCFSVFLAYLTIPSSN